MSSSYGSPPPRSDTIYGGQGHHTVSQSELRAFSEFINELLGSDPELSGIMPLIPPEKLISGSANGVLLCKLVNAIKPGSIDPNHIKHSARNKFEIMNNHKLVLSACLQLGLKIVNIGSEDLCVPEEKPYLLLAVIWQLLRYRLMAKINVADHPELSRLIEKGESVDHFAKLPAEVNLLRWVNYHLQAAGSRKRIYNFGSDIRDSEAYSVLLNQLAPGVCPPETLIETNLGNRAENVLQAADRLGCRKFVGPQDIVDGNEKLNLAFVATLFHAHPGLSEATEASERARAQELEALVRQRMAQEEAEFRRKMELERARLEEEMRQEAMRARSDFHANLRAEEAAKLGFLEEEARKLAAKERELEEARRRLEQERVLHEQSIKQFEAPPPVRTDTYYPPPTTSFYPPPPTASFYPPPPTASFYPPPPTASFYPPPPTASYYPPPPQAFYASAPALTTVTTTQTTTIFSNTTLLGYLRVTIEEARNIVRKDFFGLLKSDPYCIAQLRDQRHITRKCKGETNPVWYEDMVFTEVRPVDELVIAIWDSDKFKKDDFMGEVRVHGKDFPNGSAWFPLRPRHGHHDRVSGELRLKFSII